MTTSRLHDVTTLAAVKALDGRIYALLTEQELELLWLFAAQGRKVGVRVTVGGEPILSVRTQNEHDRLRSKNSVVAVTAESTPS